MAWKLKALLGCNRTKLLERITQLREAPIPPPHNRLSPDVREERVAQQERVGQDAGGSVEQGPGGQKGPKLEFWRASGLHAMARGQGGQKVPNSSFGGAPGPGAVGLGRVWRLDIIVFFV